MKKYIILGSVFIIVAVIYYAELYTYFVRIDIQEELPVPSKSTDSTKIISIGNFVEVDLIHKGSGEAKLVQVDGKNILRFENFNVTSGPDLYVYLSKGTSPAGDIKSLGDYIDLGLLKGTSGNQNYEVNIDIAGYKTAVIWCKRYGVLFSYAIME